MFGLFGGFNLGNLVLPILVTIFLSINNVLRALFPSIFDPNNVTGM